MRINSMVSRTLIEVGNTATNLKPSPIEPSWIIEGNPVAESCLLSKSADGQAWTVVWRCSEGQFYWNYDYDETILILEGSIVLENETMPPTRHGPGDVIFFKNGARAKWLVESRVRKLAFCRTTQPLLVSFFVRAILKIKRIAVSRKENTERLAA